MGPIINNSKDTFQVNKMDEDETDELGIIDLKKELKKCKDEKTKLQSEYFNCEKELRMKTEEAEILRSEVNDLKEIVKLGNLLNLMRRRKEVILKKKNFF